MKHMSRSLDKTGVALVYGGPFPSSIFQHGNPAKPGNRIGCCEPKHDPRQALEQVKDPDMGTDIVASGFVGQIKALKRCDRGPSFELKTCKKRTACVRNILCLSVQAERITGNISLVLEVEMYKAEVEETWAWAKSLQQTSTVCGSRSKASLVGPRRPMAVPLARSGFPKFLGQSL